MKKPKNRPPPPEAKKFAEARLSSGNAGGRTSERSSGQASILSRFVATGFTLFRCVTTGSNSVSFCYYRLHRPPPPEAKKFKIGLGGGPKFWISVRKASRTEVVNYNVISSFPGTEKIPRKRKNPPEPKKFNTSRGRASYFEFQKRKGHIQVGKTSLGIARVPFGRILFFRKCKFVFNHWIKPWQNNGRP